MTSLNDFSLVAASSGRFSFVVVVVLNTGLDAMNKKRSMSPSSPPSVTSSVKLGLYENAAGHWCLRKPSFNCRQCTGISSALPHFAQESSLTFTFRLFDIDATQKTVSLIAANYATAVVFRLVFLEASGRIVFYVFLPCLLCIVSKTGCMTRLKLFDLPPPGSQMANTNWFNDVVKHSSRVVADVWGPHSVAVNVRRLDSTKFFELLVAFSKIVIQLFMSPSNISAYGPRILYAVLYLSITSEPRHEKMWLRESPTSQNTNRPAQPRKLASILKFRL